MYSVQNIDLSNIDNLLKLDFPEVIDISKIYMKVISYTVAVVISSPLKHKILTYIKVSHTYESMDCTISQLHIHTKVKAPY